MVSFHLQRNTIKSAETNLCSILKSIFQRIWFLNLLELRMKKWAGTAAKKDTITSFNHGG